MPDSAPAGRLAPWIYDESAARADLDALDALLAARDELSEREDILPFLRAHPHLYALIGSYNRRANVYDRLGLEVPLFGQFTADLVSGDRSARASTLLEAEDARPGSMFAQRARQRTGSRSRRRSYWSSAAIAGYRPRIGVGVCGGSPPYVGLEPTASGLRLSLQQAPERKTVKGRLHLDIETDDLEAEARRLEDLGARRQAQIESWWVMADPCGNEFCVVPIQSDDFPAHTHTWEP